ncbi:MAG: hypothetical protein ACRDRI_24855 [Pseudonocardiaceae bacterium]
MSTLQDPHVSTADETARADVPREAMIAELREMNATRSDRVAVAFRTASAAVASVSIAPAAG